MPANVRPSDIAFPTRGTPGGYHDAWDEPDEAAETRAQLDEAERTALLRALALGSALREESSEHPRSAPRLGVGRPRVPFKEADA